jgi:hypothetical protein
MAASPQIPGYVVPEVIPSTWEEFEKMKDDLRAREQFFWAGQTEEARDAEMARFFTKKEGDVPEPWVSVEPL